MFADFLYGCFGKSILRGVRNFVADPNALLIQLVLRVRRAPLLQNHANRYFAEIDCVSQDTEQVFSIRFGKCIRVITFQDDRRRLDSDLGRVVDFRASSVDDRWRMMVQGRADDLV